MDIVLRAAFVYVLILFVMRVVGRRELSSMEPSDLILLIVMGDLVQNGITQSDYSVTGVVLAVSTIGLLAVATSYLTFKFKGMSRVVEGEPVILVQDGKPIDRNLNGNRLTNDELMEQARGQGVESLDEIKWAVLETNGSISVIKKQ
jgi:uncharacterized membrane protein YcaP (DUF421 family)